MCPGEFACIRSLYPLQNTYPVYLLSPKTLVLKSLKLFHVLPTAPQAEPNTEPLPAEFSLPSEPIVTSQTSDQTTKPLDFEFEYETRPHEKREHNYLEDEEDKVPLSQIRKTKEKGKDKQKVTEVDADTNPIRRFKCFLEAFLLREEGLGLPLSRLKHHHQHKPKEPRGNSLHMKASKLRSLPPNPKLRREGRKLQKINLPHQLI
nr:hypothetical protein Iba_chr02dCG4490 [Ipomoea batatas]